MTVRMYRSDDDGAPVLNGTAGAAITLLDACLVNGYGSKSAAGWTKAYSGTNVAVYRMATTGSSSGYYLRVDDQGTLPDARDARCTGYKTMSDINTGTVAFPTTAQVGSAGGGYLKKSITLNATARPWVLIADEWFFYLITFANTTTWGTGDDYNGNFAFGDMITYLANDNFKCIMIPQFGPASSGDTRTCYLGYQANGYAGGNYVYIAKDYTGISTSKIANQCIRAPYNASVHASALLGNAQSGAYPDPVTGGIDLFRIELIENNNPPAYRGLMPGYYLPYGGYLIGNVGDTFAGTGNLAGKNFILLPVQYGGSSVTGRMAFQYDGDWRS